MINFIPISIEDQEKIAAAREARDKLTMKERIAEIQREREASEIRLLKSLISEPSTFWAKRKKG